MCPSMNMYVDSVQDKNWKSDAKQNRKIIICDVTLGESEVFKRAMTTCDELHDIITAPHGKDCLWVEGYNGTVPKDAHGNTLAVVNNESMMMDR